MSRSWSSVKCVVTALNFIGARDAILNSQPGQVAQVFWATCPVMASYRRALRRRARENFESVEVWWCYLTTYQQVERCSSQAKLWPSSWLLYWHFRHPGSSIFSAVLLCGNVKLCRCFWLANWTTVYNWWILGGSLRTQSATGTRTFSRTTVLIFFIGEQVVKELKCSAVEGTKWLCAVEYRRPKYPYPHLRLD